jgi:hypothetical protein
MQRLIRAGLIRSQRAAALQNERDPIAPRRPPGTLAPFAKPFS